MDWRRLISDWSHAATRTYYLLEAETTKEKGSTSWSGRRRRADSTMNCAFGSVGKATSISSIENGEDGSLAKLHHCAIL